MRIQVKFVTERYPLQYRMMMVSLIKETLKQSSPLYYEKIYSLNKANRPFSFGVYIHDYELGELHFQVRGHVNFIISSPDPEFMLHFYNGIMNIEEFGYKDYTLRRDRVQMLSEAVVARDTVCFKTLSPLLVQGKDKKPVPIQEEAFGRELNYISDAALRGFRGHGLRRPLEFSARSMKKVVVKENIHSEDRILFFTGYQGIFEVRGEPEDLSLLSELGFGFRSSQGFGAVEVM